MEDDQKVLSPTTQEFQEDISHFKGDMKKPKGDMRKHSSTVVKK